MRVQLLCPHFEPDMNAATGMLMTGLMRGLARRGHQVDVVSSFPWYEGHEVDPEWRGRPWRKGTTDMGEIIRVWPFPTDKNNITARALGFFGFSALVAGAAQTLPRPDIVMGMSPPIFLGEAGWASAKRRGVPFVFNVQDIFPDVAVELGAIGNDGLVNLLKRHERSMYKRADCVTVLSEDQADNVRAKIEPNGRHKVEIIRNFADVDKIQMRDRNTSYRRDLGLSGKFVVQYSGNVGLSQPFELIRKAADRHATDAGVHFLINGEGAGRPDVDAWAGERSNVTVIDYVAPDQVPEVLATADLHLIPLKAGLARSSTPSKLYGVLAAGRPALASIDEGSEVWETLAEAHAGRSVLPGDDEAFLSVLDDMINSPGNLARMGENGRQYVETRLSPDSQAEAYEELFERLIHSVS